MKKILIVEDEALIAISEISILKKYGYDATTVSSSYKAIKKVDEEKIDLILMDIDLGKGEPDGVDTAKEILKKHDIPIVFLSSHQSPEIVSKTEKVTSYGYIVKSSSPTVLDASIKMAFKLYEANQIIKREEENYRTTLESVGDAIISTDNEGTIKKTNKTAEDLIGFDNLTGQNIHKVFKIVNAHTREIVENPIQKVIKTGKVEEIANHTMLISGDGTEYQIADSAAPIQNDNDETTGVVLVFRDVTEQYRKEEEMHKSEKKFREIVDYSPIGIFQTHSDGHVLFANPSMYKMVGTESEDEAKEYFNDLSSKLYASKERRDEFIQLLDEQGRVEDFEFEAITKDQRHLWFKMNARRSSKDLNNEFIIDGFTADITPLKASQEALKTERDFIQQIADISPIGITKVDRDGKIVYANGEAEKILGLKKEKITNRTYNDPDWEITSLNGGPFPNKELPFNRVKNEDVAVYDIKHIIKDDVGNKRVLSINSCPTYDSGGNFDGIVSTLLDISKQVKLEDNLRQSIKDKDMLMKELNHRVKNNLSMISSLINIKNPELKDVNLSNVSSQIDAIRIIHEKIQETGDIRKVELRGYLQGLLGSIFTSFGRESIKIENNVKELDVWTKDAIALGLIVNEVATNAIKHGFGEEKPVFTVDLKECSCSKENCSYSLHLTNNGNKFPDIDVHNMESLGMQLISALSNQLGGGFEIVKEPNTTFIIYLEI